MKSLGQHFLKNKSALRSIAESLEIAPDDIVIEIGPGHGELTEFLAPSRAKKIIAIEKDKNLYDFLVERFQDDTRVSIAQGDALTVLPNIISDLHLKTGEYKIIGNIPYYITGHLFRVISELERLPRRCVFTIQKEVAERICAAPPRMNRFAASVQFWANAKIIKMLPASDFSPPPKVSSAIMVLETVRPINSDAQNYYAAVRALFSQPRKTLTNNLAKATEQKGDFVSKKLTEIGIIPGDRPQNLTIDDIKSVAKTFF